MRVGGEPEKGRRRWMSKEKEEEDDNDGDKVIEKLKSEVKYPLTLMFNQ